MGNRCCVKVLRSESTCANTINCTRQLITGARSCTVAIAKPTIGVILDVAFHAVVFGTHTTTFAKTVYVVLTIMTGSIGRQILFLSLTFASNWKI
jgi:hypothetical protein